MARLKQMFNAVRNAGNPQAMLNQMMQSNPQIKQVMDIVNRNGGDAKKTFYEMARQKGVNPDDVLNMLK